jgi:ketosteroid isomerase-like protein
MFTWSRADREVVKRLFESYRRGDYAEAAACLALDVVYEVAQELPLRGRAEVRAMWERWDSTWGEMETVPEDFTDAGDQVLVTVYYSARGRGSGSQYEERLFDVYTFSDGQCVRKREFRQRSDAVAAARRRGECAPGCGQRWRGLMCDPDVSPSRVA